MTEEQEEKVELSLTGSEIKIILACLKREINFCNIICADKHKDLQERMDLTEDVMFEIQYQLFQKKKEHLVRD